MKLNVNVEGVENTMLIDFWVVASSTRTATVPSIIYRCAALAKPIVTLNHNLICVDKNGNRYQGKTASNIVEGSPK